MTKFSRDLTAEEVVTQLRNAGIKRSRRQVTRYAQDGTLAAYQLPGLTGQWMYRPASVSRWIKAQSPEPVGVAS